MASSSKPMMTTFESGMEKEEQSFIWRINNFHAIAADESLIDDQIIGFTAGERFGRPLKWRVYFDVETVPEDGNKLWNMFYYSSSGNKKRFPLDDLHYQFQFFIKNRKGKVMFTGDSGVANVSDVSKEQDGFVLFPSFPVDVKKRGLPDTLEIHVTFTLYSSRPNRYPTTVQHDLAKFHRSSTSKARKDLADLFQNGMAAGEMKIISSDKEEFSMSKGILAARSSFFNAMLRTDMREANEGRLELPDITGKALKLLLSFILTGELLPEWEETGVIVELTNAAAKYELPDLLAFLGGMLGKVCNLENVGPLLTLAHQLSLKSAEEELLKFVKEKGASSAGNFFKMMSSGSAMDCVDSDSAPIYL